jgi:lysozyme family protein
MAVSSYDESLKRLLAHEGGYSNHPSDPGGPTNFGITIYDYRKYVKPGATSADIRAMKVEEAKAIYRAKYWDAQNCDDLPAGVDYCVFDYGVNSGIGRAKKVLQRLVGITGNGALDEATMTAVAAHEPKQLIVAICDERMRFLKSLSTWPVFGKGWERRVTEVKLAALTMAANKRRANEQPAQAASGRAIVPMPKAARQGSAGAVIAAGAAAALQAHQDGYSPKTIVAIAIAAVAAAIGAWLYWHWRRKRQQEKPA